MDNSLQELERELEALSPQAPSAALMNRLEAELAADATSAVPSRTAVARRRYHTATSWTSWKWANWTVAAALVALLAVATHWMDESSGSGLPADALVATASTDALRPVRAARTLVESRPEAILELPDGSPVERVRDYFVDTIEWQDAAGEAQLRWEVPREAVRFVALASY